MLNALISLTCMNPNRNKFSVALPVPVVVPPSLSTECFNKYRMKLPDTEARTMGPSTLRAYETDWSGVSCWISCLSIAVTTGNV